MHTQICVVYWLHPFRCVEYLETAKSVKQTMMENVLIHAGII